MEAAEILAALAIDPSRPVPGCRDGAGAFGSGMERVVVNPSTGLPIARVILASDPDYERVASAAQEAFLSWRSVPAPGRGEVIRRSGDEPRRVQTARGGGV